MHVWRVTFWDSTAFRKSIRDRLGINESAQQIDSIGPSDILNITPMSMMTIDEIDRKLLRLLKRDGRMSNVDLAREVGLTAPPCLRRIRSLEERGYITGYHADIDPELTGYAITVFAMVSLKSQAESDLTAFENYILEIEEIRECHMLNGEIDFMLKIVAPDLPSFQKLLTGRLTSAPNVSSVKTSLTIRTAKDEPGAPIG